MTGGSLCHKVTQSHVTNPKPVMIHLTYSVGHALYTIATVKNGDIASAYLSEELISVKLTANSKDAVIHCSVHYLCTLFCTKIASNETSPVRVSHISLGVCATSLIVMQSETRLQVRCRQCAHLIIIALLFVGLVSCNIVEMSPVRSSYQP